MENIDILAIVPYGPIRDPQYHRPAQPFGMNFNKNVRIIQEIICLEPKGQHETEHSEVKLVQASLACLGELDPSEQSKVENIPA